MDPFVNFIDWVQLIGIIIQLIRIYNSIRDVNIQIQNLQHLSQLPFSTNEQCQFDIKCKQDENRSNRFVQSQQKQTFRFYTRKRIVRHRKYRPYWIENELDSMVCLINAMLNFPQDNRYYCICVTHNNKWPIHYPWHKFYYTLQLNATWKKNVY